jgi:hypothetical protein
LFDFGSYTHLLYPRGRKLGIMVILTPTNVRARLVDGRYLLRTIQKERQAEIGHRHSSDLSRRRALSYSLCWLQSGIFDTQILRGACDRALGELDAFGFRYHSRVP